MEVAWHPVYRPCPLCGEDRHRVVGRRGGAAHHAGQGVETGIVRCASCHAVYPRPFLLPDGNPYEQHDPADYFRRHDLAGAVANGRWIARRAAELLGRRGRMLELGCGRGALLRGALDEGWTVRGVEMTAPYASAADGLEIEIASIESARSLDERYDAIVLAAVLEHLYEPVACLRRVWQALEPGGILFIEVPNECSLWSIAGNAYMRARGRTWAVNLAPTFEPFHVVGFCPQSLKAVVARTGFAIAEFSTTRYENLRPSRPGFAARLEGWASEAVLALGHRLGMGAGLLCWARRPA